MKYICPLITVDDINRSRSFYETVLDQKVKYDFGENVAFASGFAIHLKPHFAELIGKKNIISKSNSFELYFEHDDIDGFEKSLIEHKVELVHPACEQPWRQKVIRFYDPDGHIIEVGESLEYLSFRLFKEGKTLSEISAITNMPAEFVSASVKNF